MTDECITFEGACLKVYCDSCKRYPSYDPRYERPKALNHNQSKEDNMNNPGELVCKGVMTNPKDLLGIKKVPMEVIPDPGLVHTAMAFAEGANKYGSYNWRSNPVKKSIYIAACRRHLMQYWNGEQYDVESGVHNLGHAIACLMIILDAEAIGNIIDDAPPLAPITELMKEVLRRKDEKTNRHD